MLERMANTEIMAKILLIPVELNCSVIHWTLRANGLKLTSVVDTDEVEPNGNK